MLSAQDIRKKCELLFSILNNLRAEIIAILRDYETLYVANYEIERAH